MSTSQPPSMRTRNLSSVSFSKVQRRGTFSSLLTTCRITGFPNQSEYESLMCKREGPRFWGDEKPLVSQAAIRVPANRRESRPCGLKKNSHYRWMALQSVIWVTPREFIGSWARPLGMRVESRRRQPEYQRVFPQFGVQRLEPKLR